MVMDYTQDLAQVAEEVSKKKISSQRLRNEQIRQGLANPNSLGLSTPSLQEATQPTELSNVQTQQPTVQAPKEDLSYLWNMYDPTAKAGQVYNRVNVREKDGTEQISQAQRYANLGFVPGRTVGKYSWTPSTYKQATTYGPTSGQWLDSDGAGLMWDPRRGYTTVGPMDESAAMRDSIRMVGSVIGGVILPGLSATGQLGTAAGASGGLGASSTELALDAGALGGAETGALGSASLGSPGMLGSGGVFGTGVNLGNTYANTLAESIAKNYATSGDLKRSALSSLFGTVSGEAGKYLSGALNPALGSTFSKIIGGAASGGLNSLFNQNNPVVGSLYGGMSGGLHGFLNSTSRDQNQLDPEQDRRNKQIANSTTGLARTLMNLRKK